MSGTLTTAQDVRAVVAVCVSTVSTDSHADVLRFIMGSFSIFIDTISYLVLSHKCLFLYNKL